MIDRLGWVNREIRMYAISRYRAAIDAWCWKVAFRRKGKGFSKTFYDLTCGGTDQALAMAIAWRDRKMAETEALSMVEFHAQKRSNNVSGVPGVHLHQTPAQPLGFWQATIKTKDGFRRAKSFSVRRLGYDKAFRLAVAARMELLAMVQDRYFLHHPDAIEAVLLAKQPALPCPRTPGEPCLENPEGR